MTRFKHFLVGLFAILFSGLPMLPVNAAPITFQFSGTVFKVGADFAADTAIGDTITGTYTFEATTVDSDPGDPAIGRYVNATTSLSYTVGGVAGSSTSNHSILVGNDKFSTTSFSLIDGYAVFGETAVTSSGYSGGSDFRMAFGDADATIFAGDALPTATGFFTGGAFAGPSDAAIIDIFSSTGNFAGVSDEGIIFPTLSGSLGASSGISGELRALITSLTSVTAASEPAVLGIFAIGLTGLRLLNRRKKRLAATQIKT